MTITIVTNEERPHIYDVETFEQAVGLLWKGAFVRETDPTTYMTEVARRVYIAHGRSIRHDTAEHFIRDLAEVGSIALKEEPDGPQA